MTSDVSITFISQVETSKKKKKENALFFDSLLLPLSFSIILFTPFSVKTCYFTCFHFTYSQCLYFLYTSCIVFFFFLGIKMLCKDTTSTNTNSQPKKVVAKGVCRFN